MANGAAENQRDYFRTRRVGPNAMLKLPQFQEWPFYGRISKSDRFARLFVTPEGLPVYRYERPLMTACFC